MCFFLREPMVGVNRCKALMNPSLSKVWNAVKRLVITFGFSRYLFKWKVYLLYFQLGWQRGLTLVPFQGTGVFCVHFKNLRY